MADTMNKTTDGELEKLVPAEPHKPSITGWQVTLSAFLHLVPELFEKMKFVLLSRFNQNALENYFSQVRRKEGSNDHPSPVDFLQRTRMLLAEGMFVMYGSATVSQMLTSFLNF
ncbi:hypothetical protein AVEN_22135-1 [Araneus ventricosus]|uniref:Transposable element P transposase-like RNase H C-terminal domain-containing protein n=1 Tax=Araneus ventricosus TaxID=182803 RepID=A0A4Y2JWB6_ARAVE|nr:hypothetical protein AVEN_22135-1 [Araneus ventricosus]